MATTRPRKHASPRRGQKRASAGAAVASKLKVGRRAGPPKWMILVSLAGIVALVGQGISYLHRRLSVPKPPEVRTAGVDPAIVKEIIESRQNVLENPTSAVSWGYLGMCFLANDFQQNGDFCLKEAERLEPSESRWPYFRSMALRAIDYSSVVPQLQLAVTLSPADAFSPRLRLCEELLERGKLDESEALVRQVLQADAKNPRALLDLGQVEAALGHLEAARDALVASAAIEPGVRVTHNALANLYRRMQDTKKADSEQSTAAKLQDDFIWPDPWYDEIDALRTGLTASLSRADRLIKDGRCDDAVGPLRQIVSRYPDSPRAWMTFGMALQLQGNLVEAEMALQKAVQIEPNRADVQLTFASILLRRGRYEQAEAASRIAVQIQPDLGDGWFILGVALQKQRKFEDSLAPLRKAIQCKPEAADPHVAMANSLLVLGQAENARKELREAMQIAPGDSKARQLMQQLPAESRPAN